MQTLVRICLYGKRKKSKLIVWLGRHEYCGSVTFIEFWHSIKSVVRMDWREFGVCVFFFLTRFCAGLWCAAQLSIGCIATAIIVYPNIDIVFVHIFLMWKRRAAAHLFSDHVVHACTRSQWTYLNLYYDVQCKWGTWGVYKQYRSAWEDYLYKEWMRMYCILCAHLKYRINFFPVHEMVR